jgi:melanoma-associated antigen
MLWLVSLLGHHFVVTKFRGRVCFHKGRSDNVVLEGKYSRSFTEVFEQTQNRLESVFRMQLVELPVKEKHQSVQQQRRSSVPYWATLTRIGAQTKSAPVTKSWILTSTLSDEIRRASDHMNSEDQNDAIYQGLVAVIVSLIYLNNGILQEGMPVPLTRLIKESLSRYLRYLSIEDNTPLMTTDKLLTTMAKQGYIDKVKDMITGEPRYDYHLGPRGKVEVGKKGALDLVKKVIQSSMGILKIGIWR